MPKSPLPDEQVVPQATHASSLAIDFTNFEAIDRHTETAVNEAYQSVKWTIMSKSLVAHLVGRDEHHAAPTFVSQIAEFSNTASNLPIQIELTVRPLIPDADFTRSRGRLEPAKDYRTDPSAFQTQAIRQARLYMSCDLQCGVVRLNKSEFELADVLLNELSEWLPAAQETVGAAKAAAEFVPMESDSDSELGASGHEDGALRDSTASGGSAKADSLNGLSANAARKAAGTVKLSEQHTLFFGGVLRQIEVFVSDAATRASFHVVLRDIQIARVSAYFGTDMNFIAVEADELYVADRSSDIAGRPLFHRTVFSDARPSNGMLQALVTIKWDYATSFKDMRLDVLLRDTTFEYTPSFAWASLLGGLLEEPPMPGIGFPFEEKQTKLDVTLESVSIAMTPLFDDFQLILHAGAFRVSSLIADSPTFALHLDIKDLALLLVNDQAFLSQPLPAAVYPAFMADRSAMKEFSNGIVQRMVALGFARLMAVDSLQVNFRSSSAGSKHIEFSINTWHMETCTDSYASVIHAINYFVDGAVRIFIEEYFIFGV